MTQNQFGTLAQDWAGGLEPDLDGAILIDSPENPELRESASVWLYDVDGQFAFNRIGVEAVAATWDRRRHDGNFVFAGGRSLGLSAEVPALPSARGPIIGGEGLNFTCIEPNRRWRVTFDDMVYDGRVDDQLKGRMLIDAEHEAPALERIPFRFEADLTMAVPCWAQDLRPDKLSGMTEHELTDAGLMGLGWRVEQLCRAQGEYTLDGKTRPFQATGNRIHRQSIRPMGAFRGHCWQAALFPDGRGFGCNAYPLRAEDPQYNTGYVYVGGKMYPAKVRRPAFLRTISEGGDDVSIELEYELGVARIEGRTLLSSYHLNKPGVNGMHLEQGHVQYSWDGVTTYGMIERSSPADQCTIVA